MSYFKKVEEWKKFRIVFFNLTTLFFNSFTLIDFALNGKRKEEQFTMISEFKMSLLQKPIFKFNISEITYMFNKTKFIDNGRGIFQYSKDLRDSNNLYHWVLRENTFERNMGEGLDIMLPYVWQYNENFTHTVHMVSYNTKLLSFLIKTW